GSMTNGNPDSCAASTSFGACWRAWRSEPQMPHASVFTRTSPAPGTGSGTSSTTRRASRITAARMAPRNSTRMTSRTPRRLASWDSAGPLIASPAKVAEMAGKWTLLIAALALGAAEAAASTLTVTRVDRSRPGWVRIALEYAGDTPTFRLTAMCDSTRRPDWLVASIVTVFAKHRPRRNPARGAPPRTP